MTAADLLTTQQVALAAGVTAMRVRRLRENGIIEPEVRSNAANGVRGPVTPDLYDPSAVEAVRAHEGRFRGRNSGRWGTREAGQAGGLAAAESRRRRAASGAAA